MSIYQKALQNSSFVKFLRYREIKILIPKAFGTPVSPPAGGLALNYNKITGFAKAFYQTV